MDFYQEETKRLDFLFDVKALIRNNFHKKDFRAKLSLFLNNKKRNQVFLTLSKKDKNDILYCFVYQKKKQITLKEVEEEMSFFIKTFGEIVFSSDKQITKLLTMSKNVTPTYLVYLEKHNIINKEMQKSYGG